MLREFIVSVFSRWWVLMGGAVFNLVGFYFAASRQHSEWALYLSGSISVLLIVAAAFSAWKDKAEKLAKVSAELCEERSVKNAPQLMLRYENGALGKILLLENISAEKHARNINLLPVTRHGFTAKAESLAELNYGVKLEIPISVERGDETYPYDASQPIGGWTPSDFSVRIPMSFEYTDPLGTTTYLAEFLWIRNRVSSDPSIESVGVRSMARRKRSS